MLTFKKVTLADQDFLKEKLSVLNCKLLNYNFVVMFTYRNIVYFEYALYKEWLIIKATIHNEDRFLFPVGTGDLEEVFHLILDYSIQHQGNCHFFQFCEVNTEPLLAWVKKLEETGKIKYDFYDVRGDFEYIYRTQNLIHLDGHDYKSKRNHVNRFLKDYAEWSTERISPDNMDEVIAFSKEWDIALEITETSKLNLENIALYNTLEHYFELEVDGILLRVNGKVAAFSFGCPLCDDTYLTLFEKADRNIQGSYAMINKEFARLIAFRYTYINRAEDVGNEGLRKAKLSYNPCILQKVFHLDITSQDAVSR
jgi:hypothetical protein